MDNLRNVKTANFFKKRLLNIFFSASFEKKRAGKKKKAKNVLEKSKISCFYDDLLIKAMALLQEFMSLKNA